MKKSDSNGEPIKKTRAAKKFEEKFDALRRQFHAAEDSQIASIWESSAAVTRRRGFPDRRDLCGHGRMPDELAQRMR
ncbi:MAG: hypothetical protein ACI4QC_05300 [Thermoguttaceae bacterium]